MLISCTGFWRNPVWAAGFPVLDGSDDLRSVTVKCGVGHVGTRGEVLPAQLAISRSLGGAPGHTRTFSRSTAPIRFARAQPVGSVAAPDGRPCTDRIE